MISLLTWHFFVAPVWLITLAWNIERMLARYFSVRILFKTLFAHWHKDAVSYRQGTVSGIALAFAWNSISRVFGFIIRLATIGVYVATAGSAFIVSLLIIGVFLIWPLAAVIGIVTSFPLLGM